MVSQLKKVVRPGVFLGLFAVASVGAAEAQEPAQAPVAKCEAEVQPAELKQQAQPVALHAALSESIGKVGSAEIAERSGARVIGVKQATEDGAPSPVIALQLDLSQAVAGEWALTFEGENGKCSAKVTVQASN